MSFIEEPRDRTLIVPQKAAARRDLLFVFILRFVFLLEIVVCKLCGCLCILRFILGVVFLNLGGASGDRVVFQSVRVFRCCVCFEIIMRIRWSILCISVCQKFITDFRCIRFKLCRDSIKLALKISLIFSTQNGLIGLIRKHIVFDLLEGFLKVTILDCRFKIAALHLDHAGAQGGFGCVVFALNLTIQDRFFFRVFKHFIMFKRFILVVADHGVRQ